MSKTYGIVAGRKIMEETWRKKKITPSQIGRLLSLGEVNISGQMSRGRASDLIAELLAARKHAEEAGINLSGEVR